MALLEVSNLSISFGGLRAVDNLSMNIEKNQLYGLIGPNGAGKTTVFNMLTGVYRPNEGIIRLDGQDLVGKKTIDINQAGIARTFQNIRLFGQQTVMDNVKIGLHNQFVYSTLTGILRLPKYHSMEKAMNERAKFLSWTAKPTIWLPTSLMASRESWRLPELWPPIPSSSFSMSRPRV